MTLLELRRAHPRLFYQLGPAWFSDEPFANRPLPSNPYRSMPACITNLGQVPTEKQAFGLPWAVEMAHLFVKYPRHHLWRGYLWCRDVDRDGQRIFVGVRNTKGLLEIHRHLWVSGYWSQPCWGAA